MTVAVVMRYVIRSGGMRLARGHTCSNVGSLTERASDSDSFETQQAHIACSTSDCAIRLKRKLPERCSVFPCALLLRNIQRHRIAVLGNSSHGH